LRSLASTSSVPSGSERARWKWRSQLPASARSACAAPALHLHEPMDAVMVAPGIHSTASSARSPSIKYGRGTA
jgi:hypothetical protein